MPAVDQAPSLSPAMPATPVAPTAEPGKQVSAAARESVGWTKISKQCADVLEVVRTAQKNGKEDLTAREIRKWWPLVFVGQDIDTSTLSPRINELVTAKRLERRPKRVCTVTGKSVGPVRVVAQQERLAP